MFQCLLLGLPAWVGPALMFANNNPAFNPTDEFGGNCPAPPPSALMITSTTSSSVTFAWAVPVVGPAVQDIMIDGWDETEGSDIPTYHANGVTNFTIPNLKSGHQYHFDFSASYCPGGNVEDHGTALRIFGGPGTIIVTQVIELSGRCTPNSSGSTGQGVFHEYCVNQSAPPNQGYTNAFVADLVYNPFHTVHIGVGSFQNVLKIGQIHEQDMYFYFWGPPEGSQDYGKYAKCYADINNNGNSDPSADDLLFTVEYVESTTAPARCKFRITFDGTFGFSYCNDACGIIQNDPKERTDNSNEEEAPDASSPAENMLLSLPAPNPFSQYTSFRFTLSKVSPVEITLYDPMGRLIRTVENTTAKEPGEYEVTIDGADLPDGVYFLNIMSGENKKVFPLVKRE